MRHKPFNLSGIGLRAPHVQELLTTRKKIGFLEAHSENYFGGGKSRKLLSQIAEMYPLSLHGVGLSLGSVDGLDKKHLLEIKSLVDEFNPIFVSEHLSWSAYNHIHVPDLLPIPFIKESLDIFVKHVSEFQDKIGRQILIENPSNYIVFRNMDYSEPEFLNKLSERSGCGILLDINNIYVSAHNNNYNPKAYIDCIQTNGSVMQFHLAGYQINKLDNGETIYLDTHSKAVYPEVWHLYEYALNYFPDVKTLIEWDSDIPTLDILIAEANKANIINKYIQEKNNAYTS